MRFKIGDILYRESTNSVGIFWGYERVFGALLDIGQIGSLLIIDTNEW